MSKALFEEDGSFQLRGEGGWPAGLAQALSSTDAPGIVLCRLPGEVEGTPLCWRVTHRRSGLLMSFSPTREKAEALALELAAAGDWDRELKDLPQYLIELGRRVTSDPPMTTDAPKPASSEAAHGDDAVDDAGCRSRD